MANLHRPGWIALLLALLTGCGNGDALQHILAEGEMVVATRNGPTTYFMDKGEQAGFEHELVKRFAAELGVSVRYESLHNLGDILESVRRGQADFAAAGLTITPSRAAEFRFSEPYYDIEPTIIYLAGTEKPRSVEDLTGGRIVTMAGSAHAENLAQLKEQYPDLEFQEIRDVEPLDLMDMVSSGAATYAIIDSNEFVANRGFHPKLRIGFKLGNSQNLAWLFPGREEDRSLRQRANAFLARLAEDGTLDRLKERQFGHAWGVDQVDSRPSTGGCATGCRSTRS
jgi:membrane-bound lytic murein transglycosylase F